MTLRAEREALTRFQAVQRITGRPMHEVFRLAVAAYVATLPAESQAAIERETRRHERA